ncbi:MAG: benzoate-CoA ligase family protein [Acidobacteriia bacterium]|nr:benzoate-CoA ligase family protein [Terriglobia bacterium]
MLENATDWLLPDSLTESEDADRPAIRWNNQSITYRDLVFQTNQIARFLQSSGLGPRQCLALILRDSPTFIATFLAAMKIGAVPALISTFAEGRELEHILNLCAARMAIVEEGSLQSLQALRHRLRHLERVFVAGCGASPNLPTGDDWISAFSYEVESMAPVLVKPTTPADPAFFLFTSGSTGEPKAVVHSHSHIRHTVENYGRSVLKLTPEDRTFSSSRLYFAYGLGNSLSFPLGARATTILCSERPTPELISRILRDESPTVFFGVPAVYRALLEYHRHIDHLKVDSLRFCVSAGEALPAVVFEEWKQVFGVEILDGIGTTEALHMFLSNRLREACAGSSGTAIEGYEIRILDESGREVEAGVTGNLWVKGNTLGPYYSPVHGFSSASVTDWVRTGDIYRCDKKGHFYFCGRSSDHFKVQGLWVSPIEIEEALLQHEAVLETGVVGIVERGGLITARAHVVLKNNKQVSAAELKEFLSHRLHSYQVPREIVFMDSLPRTATGKLQRYKLRELEIERR